MTIIDLINLAFAILSIGLGAVGWLAPRYVMEVLDIQTTKSNMGLSEIRAASGALYIGLGLGAVILASSDAYIMLGAVWLGAALGRITSILLDGSTPKKIGFFVCEVAIGVIGIAINL